MAIPMATGIGGAIVAVEGKASAQSVRLVLATLQFLRGAISGKADRGHRLAFALLPRWSPLEWDAQRSHIYLIVACAPLVSTGRVHYPIRVHPQGAHVLISGRSY